MSLPRIIEAEGITWPLETFMDAHRYIRTRREVPDFATLPGVVDALMSTGEVREAIELRAIPWHDCLAVRVPDGSMKLALCHGCEATIVAVEIVTKPGGVFNLEQELCDDCAGGTW
jgi:hypothetical protein